MSSSLHKCWGRKGKARQNLREREKQMIFHRHSRVKDPSWIANKISLPRLWHWRFQSSVMKSLPWASRQTAVCSSLQQDSEISQLESQSHGPCLHILTRVQKCSFVMVVVTSISFFILLKLLIICFYTIIQSLPLHSITWKAKFLALGLILLNLQFCKQPQEIHLQQRFDSCCDANKQANFLTF